jgi:hypothetical protein
LRAIAVKPKCRVPLLLLISLKGLTILARGTLPLPKRSGGGRHPYRAMG